jgi:AraC-like DNA-binding protein
MGEVIDFPAVHTLQLIDVVARWNVTAEELLSPLGLSREAVTDPAVRLSLPVIQQLVARARALTGEPGLGFYLGLQMRISSLGYLGFAAMTAATLREAIEIGVRYAPTRTAAVGLRLHVEGPAAALVIEERADLGSVRDVVLQWLIVGLVQIGEALTGKTLEGSVDIAGPAPSYFDRFVNTLSGVVRFGQPETRLLFDAENLDLPLVMRDPAALKLAQQQCERELDALGYPQRTAAAVRRALADRLLTVDEVARQLGQSQRTLKRRLAAEGTTYSQILDEERRERALLLIRSPALSLDQVAEHAGYTDLANFTRAFRRWTGKTPAAYRKQ